ncbi:archaemetzincin [Anaeramoeba ignava]|uniref:Archaemetzincin n=1 Tax=Anaeramoeba ignava TaxID=1746090 RepID=A0A9Q0R572_ANAIG|nr:archaemetzincin [Anaeramoeba ignava]
MEQKDPNLKELKNLISQLENLHKPKPKPKKGDWLAEHKEKNQTFEQYLESSPTQVKENQKFIYIQPIGIFTGKARKIIEDLEEYLRKFFGIETKVFEDLTIEKFPSKAQRIHPDWGDFQLETHYIMDEILVPSLPKDAVMLIALSLYDLWPGKNWNFVFGMAYLHKRVGVWSIYRNGDPEESEESYQLCLSRTLKTASHEIGHIFSIPHCILHPCNMNGSNNRVESDDHPHYLCPSCLAKLCYATKQSPLSHLSNCRDFFEKVGFSQSQEMYELSLSILKSDEKKEIEESNNQN